MCLSVVTRLGFTVLVTSDKVSNESISRRIWMWYAHRLLYIMKSETMIQKKRSCFDISREYANQF
ncbi:hypothetical protein Scep_011118 [Stephania cephalantha]|uniref:Uncharacterized protein n=1 Tax=Stephania cephalantha TaxID=152367 RepID=A0AAP0P7Z3_9MAGN